MKQHKKQPVELAEIHQEIVNLDLAIDAIGRVITLPKKGVNILRLKLEESKMIKDKKRLTIKAHQMENRLIDLGRGSAFGLYRVPLIKTNQYSN